MGRIVGIDLGLRNTGIVTIDTDTRQFLTSELVTTSKKDTWISCISKIETAIEKYLTDVDMVCLENYSFGSSHGREVAGEVGGIAKNTIVKRLGELPLLVSPTSLKLFVTGKGRAPPCPEGEVKSTWGKKWILNEVNTVYKKDFDTDHEADAFTLAVIGWTVYHINRGNLELSTLPDHQQKVITTLLKEEV